MLQEDSTAATAQADLEHDLDRLTQQGPDAIEAVTYRDIRYMGAPLALSKEARHRIYHIAMADLARQLQRYQSVA